MNMGFFSLQLCRPKAASPSSMATGWLTGQGSLLLWEHSWRTNDPTKSALALESPSLHLGHWLRTYMFMWDANRRIQWDQHPSLLLKFSLCLFSKVDLPATRSQCILWIQCSFTKHPPHSWARYTFSYSAIGWVHTLTCINYIRVPLKEHNAIFSYKIFWFALREHNT